jgi:hypothetical protein
MGFETIERVSAQKNDVPANGVRIAPRGQARGSNAASYISIQIGSDLAKAAGISGEECPVRLMIGASGNDVGKICIAFDRGGSFIAKGKPGKNYKVAVGASSVKGRFALDFPPFVRAPVEVVAPNNGQPKSFTFHATADMLTVDA